MHISPITHRLATTSRMPIATACLGALALLAAGCQDARAPSRGTPVYAVDVNGGAKSCTTSAVDMSGSGPQTATMTVGNDGGWCGVTVAQSGGRPFSAGLLQTRAQHGRVHVHTVGDNTRIDYTPDTGFTGADSFAVKLVPGNATLTVNVTVSR